MALFVGSQSVHEHFFFFFSLHVIRVYLSSKEERENLHFCVVIKIHSEKFLTNLCLGAAFQPFKKHLRKGIVIALAVVFVSVRSKKCLETGLGVAVEMSPAYFDEVFMANDLYSAAQKLISFNINSVIFFSSFFKSKQKIFLFFLLH